MTSHLPQNKYEFVISATEFRAKCLRLLDRVAETGERVQVTKRGKVVAELGQAAPSGRRLAGYGFAKDEWKLTGDIMAPIDVDWGATK
jgi:prevent-host-death family protein